MNTSLAAGLDALEDASVDQEPGEEERPHELPLRAAGVLEAARDLQDAVPEMQARKMLKDTVQCTTGWGGHLFGRFCNMFS